MPSEPAASPSTAVTEVPRICPVCGTRYAPAAAGPAFCPNDGAYLVRLDEMDDAEEDPLLGRRIGEFALVGRIGRGGMGSVYRAIQVGVDRVVAVKVPNPELMNNPEVVQRFFQEARATAQLQHRHLAVTYTTGSTLDGLHYIAMEYVPDGSLTQLIEKSWRLVAEKWRYELTPERAVRLVGQIMSALAHAHRAGIVHRDLKPDNVLLQRDDEDGELVKLVDFGIAKVLGVRHRFQTSDGLMLGTALYMAPELFDSSQADPRADVYAAGLVLYELLCGLLPFAVTRADKAAAPMRLVNQRLSQPVPAPVHPAQPLSPQLVRLCLDMLDLDPDCRPKSASEVRERLRALPEAIGGGSPFTSGVIQRFPMPPQIGREDPTAHTAAPRLRVQDNTILVGSVQTPQRTLSPPLRRTDHLARGILLAGSGLLLLVLAALLVLRELWVSYR